MDISNFPDAAGAANEVRQMLGGARPGVYVLTFGCQQNEADSERLLGAARSMGFLPVEKPEQASLILINTCAIREHAELKALSVIGQFKHLKSEDPSRIIGVCGCMSAEPARVEQFKSSYPYVSFTLQPGAADQLAQMVLNAMRSGKRFFSVPEQSAKIAEGIEPVRRFRHKAWVSVMYGCNNFCSYCIVPYVRGRERSRSREAILNEVRQLIADGCRDITLLGQNVNSYAGSCDFPTLLRDVASLPGEFLVRFMTSHPKDASPQLLRVMADCPKVAPHLHLPLQSGSDRILREMNRKYTREHYLGIVADFRRAVPHASLTTDLIVGFPGETEEDFEATLQVMRQARFDMIYSFLYSPRRGTPAADRPDQVPDDIKRERMQRLLRLQDELAGSIAAGYLGKTVRVLSDGPSKDGASGLYSGRTGGNKLVHYDGLPDDIGRFIDVKIDRCEPFALYGTAVRTGTDAG